MTSNLGSGIIQEKLLIVNEDNREQVYEETRKEVFEMLKQTIRPEFLNRIDEIIMFSPLDESQVLQIVELQFDQLHNLLQKNGVDIRIKKPALDWIANRGFDLQFGARPVKRMLQKYLVNELSKQILANKINSDRPVIVDVEGDSLVFSND